MTGLVGVEADEKLGIKKRKEVTCNAAQQLRKYFEDMGVELPINKKSKKPSVDKEFVDKFRDDPKIGKIVRVIEARATCSEETW